uniref:Uncharacterized protein n=1 Tax=Moniliophthora roreri TaxID=221103 RepID=A0A0W0FUF0_MONRR
MVTQAFKFSDSTFKRRSMGRDLDTWKNCLTEEEKRPPG